MAELVVVLSLVELVDMVVLAALDESVKDDSKVDALEASPDVPDALAPGGGPGGGPEGRPPTRPAPPILLVLLLPCGPEVSPAELES